VGVGVVPSGGGDGFVLALLLIRIQIGILFLNLPVSPQFARLR